MANGNDKDKNVKEGDNPAANDSAYADMFVDKLKTFNDMYKTKLSRDKIVSALSDSWALITEGSEEKKADGKKQLKALFEAVLEHSFKVEKEVAYDEGRFPDYTEIIKSTNDLIRASMFAFTDMYRNQERKPLFDETAFGGMTADEMVDLTASDGAWQLDQKSEEAWEIQSKEAKSIAEGWKKKFNPYQTMIDEMDSLIDKNNNGSLDRKDVLNKLAAAEWLLLNNDDMMIKDADDPYNKTPNWNNRYWKSITKAREAIGIPKYVSMRELIQGNYAVMQKTMSNVNYHKEHVNEQIFAPEKRAVNDSMDKQNEAFVIQSAKIADNQPINDQRLNNIEMKGDKIRISVIEEDEYRKAKHAYGDVSKFIVERVNDLKVDNSINKQ